MARKPNFRFRDAGFTLVEIIIVAAILGILASILLSATAGFSAKAKAVACLSNLRQIGSGISISLGDNNNTFFTDGPAGSSSNWINSIYQASGASSNLFRCPADRSPPIVERTYRFNATAGSSGPSASATLFGKSITRVVRPSTKIMVFCVSYKGTASMPLFKVDTDTWNIANDQNTNLYTIFPRLHGTNGVNVLFVDGHAGFLTYPIDTTNYYWDR